MVKFTSKTIPTPSYLLYISPFKTGFRIFNSLFTVFLTFLAASFIISLRNSSSLSSLSALTTSSFSFSIIPKYFSSLLIFPTIKFFTSSLPSTKILCYQAVGSTLSNSNLYIVLLTSFNSF
ncbi:hypothetical protein AAJ76_940009119 [Vairimorpha ceranae]|uniref:Uncharacterized protein n=1 Tax=Vairimorpha ceranae TaxID=40302 RepID=A0A0F9W990_9MICR|nr:hypothetical protein AAJ76_940009119 [Vairimorpha ceranae]KKO74251.1 hypothetical protein AAJ76_940009119 [Vairimorpha ceranae]